MVKKNYHLWSFFYIIYTCLLAYNMVVKLTGILLWIQLIVLFWTPSIVLYGGVGLLGTLQGYVYQKRALTGILKKTHLQISYAVSVSVHYS